MANAIEYALMAGRVYQSTRGQINWLPDLLSFGWTEFLHQQEPSGFEAIAFQKGSEIVISFAGTGSNVDWWANAGGFFGVTSTQLEQAADYYLQVKASAPVGATISFTGHSLGGGLAALMAVFFGETAVTFDQAPFRNSASVEVANTLLSYLSDPARGYSAQDLQGLTNFISTAANGGIPNEGNVLDFSVQGEILSAASALRIGSQSSLTHSPDNWFGSSVDLHSQALLTAFLQSDQTAPALHSFRDVTLKLTDLLKMIFDSNLFAHTTASSNTTDENFIERLVRHQNGITGNPVTGETPIPADAMLTRFTADLWKLAQDDGLTLHDNNPTNADLNEVSKTLIAFAMQKYYEEQLAAGATPTELFTDLAAAGAGSGGIQFDMADVSNKFAIAFQNNQKLNLADAKGFDLYFKYYLQQSVFTDEERQLIQSLLPYLRDWYVQAGASGMLATDTLNRGAFMLGGNGSDALVGGTGADLLVGNAGADLLQGGGGNDTLLGGSGNDAYVYTTGDGFDTILDSDGNGSIAYDGVLLAGGNQYGDARVHRSADGHLYVTAGSRLIIDNNMLVLNYSPTQGNGMGLTMTGSVAGNNNVIMGVDNVLPNGSTYDILIGGASNDLIYADTTQISVADAILQGNTQTGIVGRGDFLSGRSGDDTLIGSASDDVLAGGGGSDLLISGGGSDTIVSDFDITAVGLLWDVLVDPTTQARSILGATGVTDPSDSAADVIYAGRGEDYVWAGIGNDIVFGEGDNDYLVGDEGNDYLDGGSGVDTIFGGDDNDIIVGGAGADTLYGGAGQDIYIFNRGDGVDTIFDTPADADDPEASLLVLGPGIRREDIKFRKGSLFVDFGAEEGGDPVGIHFEGFDALDPINTPLIGEIRFDDGEVMTYADVLAQGFDIDGSEGDDDGQPGNLPALTGTAVTDRIRGLGGHDVLVGGGGEDQLFGGTGDDWLAGDSDDTPESQQGADLLDGGDGNDYLRGYGGDDTLLGGAGDDQLLGEAGADTLDGGAGKDLLLGGEGSDLLSGGAGNDVLSGGTGDDSLVGDEGADQISGGDGADRIEGGEGSDKLWGEAGADELTGGADDDELLGGEGDDVLAGGVGRDFLFGQGGNDVYAFNVGDGEDYVDDGAGVNTIRFGEAIAPESLVLTLISPRSGLQYLHIGYGTGDSVTLSQAQASIQRYEFADGRVFSYSELTALLPTPASAQEKILYGTSNADSLSTTSSADHRLLGASGADYLSGGSGNDTLDGGSDNDGLYGWNGNDICLKNLLPSNSVL